MMPEIKKLMQNLKNSLLFPNQKGIAHLFLLILLLAGIGLGVYLVGQKTNIFPWAASNPISTPCPVSAPCPSASTPVGQGSASYSLTAPSNVNLGSDFVLRIKAKTPTEAANTFLAELTFDNSKLEVTNILMDAAANSFISQIDDLFYDNATGEISLLGGLPDPGLTTVLEQGETMAEISFTAKAAGQAAIALKSSSEILSNDTASNIISGGFPTLNVNIGVQTPSPSPTFLPSPTATPTPEPSIEPSPSPSPLEACTIVGVEWVSTSNPAKSGDIVTLKVTGRGDCAGQTVTFIIGEDDRPFGSDGVSVNPASATFSDNNIATTSWVAEFQQDGFNGYNNPPEYFFTATLQSNPQVYLTIAPDQQLKVNNLRQGEFINGDGNRDGRVDRKDLAVLRKWWGKTGFPQEIDIDDNGVLNTFDMAGLRRILEINGIIKTRSR